MTTTGARVPRTLPELLDDAVVRSPAREVVFPVERATWPAVRVAARVWAAGLHRAGVRRGDRVLLVLPGGLDAVLGLVAATMLGAIPTPVNPRGTVAEVAWLRGDADPAVVVATPELTGLAGPGAVTPAELVADADADAPPVVVTPDDPMILLYTSGTTSRPRGCVHTHAAYTALGENLVERLRLRPDDRFWTPLPLHHCGGIDVLMGSLAATCSFVHVGTFEPGVAWRQLVAERAGVAFPAFDTIWLPVLDHPDFDPAAVPELRTVINVGPAERMAAMQARLPGAVQISCLGGTEAGGFCCVGSVDDPPEARFVSRLKDMLKVGGENVAAAEVEGRLAEHPAVGVVAVVGAPDARLGEVVAAFVELAPGRRDADPDALAAELVAHCLDALAPFKAPRHVVFVDGWPISGTKIQKGELRDRIAADLAARGVTEAPRVSRPARHAAG